MISNIHEAPPAHFHSEGGAQRGFTPFSRDLAVQRAFDTAPILWTLLSVAARARPPSFTRCHSVVVSLLSNMYNSWCAMSTSQLRSPSAECIDRTVLLLSILRFGILLRIYRLACIFRSGEYLPPPLAYSDEVVSFLTPGSVASLLALDLRFVLEHPPMVQHYAYVPSGGSMSWRRRFAYTEAQYKIFDDVR